MSKRKFNSVEIEGADEIIKILKTLGDKAEDVIKEATWQGAEIVREEIERRTPEDSKELKLKGFMTKVGSMKNGAANAVVTLTDRKFEYAFYLEFGAQNRGMGGGAVERLAKKLTGRKGNNLPAQPFIRPAYLAKRKEAAAMVEAVLRAVIKEYDS